MAKIYLRPIGGLGARLIPLLQGLSAVRESSHELVVCWPLSSRRGGGRSGAHREQSFELPLTDLYDFDPPITDMRESAYLAKTEELPYYPLRHTQNLDGSGQTPVFLDDHEGEDFCVDAHGLFQFVCPSPDSMTPVSLLEAYKGHFRLKPPQKALYDDLLVKFEGRPTVGVYLRQSSGANYQVLRWDAERTLLPRMREQASRDSRTLFFVVSDEEPLLTAIVREFGAENVLITPKPHIVNHPDEMLGVTVDIELMRHVDIYYPTWGSWLGKIMGLVRYNKGSSNPLAWGYGVEGNKEH